MIVMLMSDDKEDASVECVLLLDAWIDNLPSHSQDI